MRSSRRRVSLRRLATGYGGWLRFGYAVIPRRKKLLPVRKANLGKQSYDHLMTAANRPLEKIPLSLAATIDTWNEMKSETGVRNCRDRAREVSLS